MGLKESGLRGSLRSVSTGVPAIPDEQDLHAHYDFSQEDGSLPITDQTGNGRDIVNGGYSGVSADINGVQAGEFDGTSDGVYTDQFASNLSPPYTYAYVAELNDPPNNELSIPVNSQFESTDLAQFIHRTDSLNTVQMGYGDILRGGSEFDTLVTGIFSSSGSLRTMGVERDTGDTTGQSAEAVEIGSRGGGTDRNFDGKFGELLVYDGDKSSNIGEIEGYLADKWGITI